MTAEYNGIGPWHCTECGHSHSGRSLAYICIGCPCDFVPDHPLADAHLRAVSSSPGSHPVDLAADARHSSG